MNFYDSRSYIAASEFYSVLTECAERSLLGSIVISADAVPYGYLKLSPQLSVGFIKLLVAATDRLVPSLVEISFGKNQLTVRTRITNLVDRSELAKICRAAVLAGFELTRLDEELELSARIEALTELSVYAVDLSWLRELFINSLSEK